MSESFATSPRHEQQAICVGVDRAAKTLDELIALLNTAGVEAIATIIQPARSPHPDTYLGKGKLEELKRLAYHRKANLIVCDDELSPRQERNMEQALELPVIDRTTLILDIFARHAQSAEGKVQVELAQLQYNLARMRGLWTHLERLGAGVGTRGPGESQIETDRRLARQRINRLQDELEAIHIKRGIMRKQRAAAATPTIVLAGYTNAGKSKLFNRLAGHEGGVADQLFHTLDPLIKKATFGSHECLLTDTVGFIQKLPHQLIGAFAATLEEAVFADLIFEVIDAALDTTSLQDQAATVGAILAQIGAHEVPRLVILNKVDLLDSDARDNLAQAYPEALQVSALTGEGLDQLEEHTAQFLGRQLHQLDLFVPFSQERLVADLHQTASVRAVEYHEKGTYLLVEVDDHWLDRLNPFIVTPPIRE